MATLQMKAVIREAGEMHVVGFAKNYTMETVDEIKKLWDEHFLPRHIEIEQWDKRVSLGVCISRGESFSYMAGAVVSEIGDVPAGMTSMTIPAQRYAVVTLKGDPLMKIGAAFDYLYKEWLPTSGHEAAENGITFELYDERFTIDTDCDNAELDIYIALK